MICYWKFLFLTALSLGLTNCTIGNYPGGTLYQLSSQPLSLNNPRLRTCVFDAPYLIVHFPMHHYPANGHYTQQIYEKVTQSQFQLLHTILDYNRSQRNLFVFDEHFTTDTYNSQYFQSLSSRQSDTYQRIDGQIFKIGQLSNRAKHLFINGIPRYYEHLSSEQKNLLFNIGATFTLYLLGEIPRIHKVISPEQFLLVKNALLNPNNTLELQGNDYWVYDFREGELKKEVLNFLQNNRNSQRMTLLIAYGANHDLSDEFSGFSFQAGHNFCLKWEDTTVPSQPVLP